MQLVEHMLKMFVHFRFNKNTENWSRLVFLCGNQDRISQIMKDKRHLTAMLFMIKQRKGYALSQTYKYFTIVKQTYQVDGMY